MRFVLGILQCVLVHILLISPTDYSEAQTKTSTCSNECGVLKETCYAKTCKFKPETCTYRCNLLEDFWDSVDDKSRSHTITFECSKKGQWVPVDPIDVECKNPGTVTMVKENFHHMRRLNKFVVLLLRISYNFLGLSSYYQRADVNLPGFSKFMSDRWRQHTTWAHDVIHYVNKRGGNVDLFDISATPVVATNKPGLTGLRRAIGITREINRELVSFRKKLFQKPGYSTRNRRLDPHLKHILDLYLERSVKNIYQTGKLIRTLQSFGTKDYGLGEYVLDRKLRDKGDKI